MNWVDGVALAVALLAGLSGARQGMLTAVASFAGVLGGAVLGVRIAPPLVAQVDTPSARVALGLGIVVLLVAVGESLGVWIGRLLRGKLRAVRLRQADSGLGAVVQALAALVVAWLVALPLTSSSYTELTTSLRRSAVLHTVDTAMPQFMRDLPNDLTRLFNMSEFPGVLDPFATTPITEVGPPNPALQGSPVVDAVQSSVLKIRGRAPSCGRVLEGTGFVVAPERVLTNAHVVAGTESVLVETADGPLDATVVSYDPHTDAAVLAVPGLVAPPLAFAPAGAVSGADSVVVGYPLDGPYLASPARVRERIELRGPDIYDGATVTREVYTVRAVVRSGNSGGPLLDPQGRVLGMVFGAAIDDDDTGFVLTAEEIVDDVATAPGLVAEVETGACAL